MSNLQRSKFFRGGVGSILAAALTFSAFNAGPMQASAANAGSESETSYASEMPSPVVDYDFSKGDNGTGEVSNSAASQTFGSARITDGKSTQAGRYEDGALTMDGKYYVDLPDGILQGKSSVTVSTVVKNNEFNSSSSQWTYLWSMGGTGQTAQGSWATSTHTSLYTSLTSRANGEGESYFSASQNLSMDQFQTLTATIDGASKRVTLYINGKSVGSSVASATPADFLDNTHNVIGESRYPGVGDAWFKGSLRSFSVYDSALSQEQIARILPKDGVEDLLTSQADAIEVPASATSDFTLPVSTSNATVRWSSSDSGTIAVDESGKALVTGRPENTTVTLKATLTPHDGMAVPAVPIERSFSVLVPQRMNDDDLRSALVGALTIDDADDVRGDLLLPRTVSLDAYGISGDVTWKSSNPEVIAIAAVSKGSQSVSAVVKRPECSAALPVDLVATIDSSAFDQPLTKTITVKVQPQSLGVDTDHTRVSVHDPSIVKANGVYYSFGSHRAFAKSTDLQHWQTFTNNLNTDYEKIFSEIWNSWPKQDSNPDVTGNMWAPDVIFNKALGKWCMYMSLNGGGFPYQKSVMVLLTADDIEGDWTYVGPVAYSGFQASNAASTDVYRVLGDNADLSRYASLEDTGINMIDANVQYDEQGNLWMSFGSWFGGIWMLKLDSSTGLRDYRTVYKTVANVSDAYYGHKLAGGHGNSGEGSSLVKKGKWWYLFLSYGGLSQTGGYQIREFRSSSITGPYLDQNGNAAVYSEKIADDTKINRGLKILSSYQQEGSSEILTSQGGNSMLLDDDGQVYNVYHTRFVRTTGNLEEHQVRVQQMMTTPDGWLVSAPYEYSGGLRQKSAYTEDAVAGEYQVVVHDPTVFYSGGGATSSSIYRAVTVTLNKDGSISGAAKGRWNVEGTSLTLKIDESQKGALLHGTYVGTVGEQATETGGYARVFSMVGGDVFPASGSDASYSTGKVAIWGSKSIDVDEAIGVCGTDGRSTEISTDTPTGANAQDKTSIQASSSSKGRILASTGSPIGILLAVSVAASCAGFGLRRISRRQR